MNNFKNITQENKIKMMKDFFFKIKQTKKNNKK